MAANAVARSRAERLRKRRARHWAFAPARALGCSRLFPKPRQIPCTNNAHWRRVKARGANQPALTISSQWPTRAPSGAVAESCMTQPLHPVST